MRSLFLWAVALCYLFSCQSEQEESVIRQGEVPTAVLDQLNALGFNTIDIEVKKIETGYIVEGDILLTEDQIMHLSPGKLAPTEEYYHTDNLVTGLPRAVSVFVNMPQLYRDATDIALARYNAENLNLTFQRVGSSAGANIVISASPFFYFFFGILGSAGFPTANGDPFNEILLTRQFYDNVSNINGLATTIAHEIGHCIGFRHTDFMDRSFSCGGSPSNEGDGGVGANFIPGTPAGPDPGSWMLACGNTELDRPFTNNDQIALSFLY